MLAVLLVAPLMFERVRSLEDTRARQIATASEQYANITHHSAETQREVISSVETMLKSAAYIRAASGIGRSCEILRASLPANLPWIRSIMLVSKEGVVQCSTLNVQVGLNIGDRDYFKKAQETRDFVFSDYLFGRTNNRPIMMAAYPVSAINPEEEAVAVAGINLDWLSKIMATFSGRPGISALLIDSTGVVMAAPPDQAGMIGRPLDNVPLLSAITYKALSSNSDTGSISFTATDGGKRAISFARIPGTQSRLVVSVDEAKVTAAINRDIRTAYLQLGFVCLFVLLGALIGAEKLIIKPIELMTGMAKRFGEGDSSARVARSRLPAEFMPLARAFNAMAAQLSQRERELVATNDRLTVMASIDMLSGLANRRGFQSRLDFEWMKAQQYQQRAVAADDRCRSLQALQRHLWPPRGRRLPDPARRSAGRHRRRHHGFCRPLWRRGILPAAAEHQPRSERWRSAKPCARPCKTSACRTSPPATAPSPSASASPRRFRTTPKPPAS